MRYRFATDRPDYSDFSSGKVFYSLPRHPAFPVRLVSEIFQRCVALRQVQGATGRCALYDPCCGGAYHLSVLAYLHRPSIASIIASDVDEEILAVARRNLDLLTLEGMERRIAEISRMRIQYGKPSHEEALMSAQRMKNRLSEMIDSGQIEVRLFPADVTESRAIRGNLAERSVNVVISDIPYGWQSAWRTAESSMKSPLSPAGHMLESLLPVVSERAVVAIASDKGQQVSHDGYRRVERFQVGKRRVTLLQPVRG